MFWLPSEQYQASMLTLADGSQVYGRVIYSNDEEVAGAPNPYNFGEIHKTPAQDVEKTELSQISMMPPGTIFGMNKDELMDLVAYLVSAGNPKHKAFKSN